MAPGARHLVSNVSIDGDGDDATARLYLQMWSTAGGAAESKLVISGRYEDTLQRDDGTLALRHPQDDPRRLTRVTAMLPVPGLGRGLTGFRPGGVHEPEAPRVRLQPVVPGGVEGELAAARPRSRRRGPIRARWCPEPRRRLQLPKKQ